jgi:hypothetical protein
MQARLDKKLSFGHVRVPPRSVRYDSEDIEAFIAKAKAQSLGKQVPSERVATDAEVRANAAFEAGDDAALLAEARGVLLLEGEKAVEDQLGFYLKARGLWPLPALGGAPTPPHAVDDDDDDGSPPGDD